MSDQGENEWMSYCASERVNNIGEPLLTLHFKTPPFSLSYYNSLTLFGYSPKPGLMRCRLQDRGRAQVGYLGSDLRKHQ